MALIINNADIYDDMRQKLKYFFTFKYFYLFFICDIQKDGLLCINKFKIIKYCL